MTGVQTCALPIFFFDQKALASCAGAKGIKGDPKEGNIPFFSDYIDFEKHVCADKDLQLTIECYWKSQ